MKEKRTFKRMLKRVPVKYSFGEVESVGVISNLSKSGLFIKTRKPFCAGVPVKLFFETDEKHPVKLIGVVARAIRKEIDHSRNGMGVHLISVPPIYDSVLNDRPEI